jgi:hypothetical protein
VEAGKDVSTKGRGRRGHDAHLHLVLRPGRKGCFTVLAGVYRYRTVPAHAHSEFRIGLESKAQSH